MTIEPAGARAATSDPTGAAAADDPTRPDPASPGPGGADDLVRAALRQLAALPGTPIAGHVAVFEEVHGLLAETLAGLDDDAGGSGARPSGDRRAGSDAGEPRPMPAPGAVGRPGGPGSPGMTVSTGSAGSPGAVGRPGPVGSGGRPRPGPPSGPGGYGPR